MSWLFSRGLVENYLQATCSVGEQFAQLSTNSTPLAYLCNDKTMGSFRHSRYGITFAHLTEDIGEELLTWFREVSLAKTLAQQEQMAAIKERDLTEANQDCGASLPESLAKLNQNGFWLKTPITCEPRVLDEFSKIWPASGMMLRGECYPLKTVEPITNENECGLLPTPTSHNAKEGGYPAEGTRNTPTLGWVLGGKINPQFTEWMMGWPIGWTDLKPLEMDKFQSWQQQHSIS